MAQTPYISLGDLKAYLKIADTDTTQDIFLTNVIGQVQRFIEEYTHRSFGWGDPGDNEYTDYSNSDNLAVSAATVSGTTMTITFMGIVPWVGSSSPTEASSVVLSGFAPSSLDGIYQVQTAANTQITIAVPNGTANPTLLGSVQSNVQNYRLAVQEQYDGFVGNTIYLRNSDVRSIQIMQIGLRNIAMPVTLDHTQYVWRNDGRVIIGGAYFNSYNSSVYSGANDNAFYGSVAAGYQTVTVSYYHGYIGVPPDIALAALDLASIIHTQRASQGIMAENIGDYKISYLPLFRAGLTKQPDMLGTLGRYRRRRV